MFPLLRHDHRRLPPDYDGLVVTCDVDKTYLDTDFKSLKGLARIPFEWGEDKVGIVGMRSVLRGLRAGVGDISAQTPFYFLTASPPILASALTRKMLLDGVQCDGITFKDWQRLLLTYRRPRWIKQQLPYKLAALFHQRRLFGKHINEILIGDDMEADALVYAIYADAVAGRLDERALRNRMREQACAEVLAEEVVQEFKLLPDPTDCVQQVYIYLAKQTEPARFHQFGSDLIVCKSPFQLAVHLWCCGRVRGEVVMQCAQQILKQSNNDRRELATQLKDLAQRDLLPHPQADELNQLLAELDLPVDVWLHTEPAPALQAPSRKDRGGNWLPAK